MAYWLFKSEPGAWSWDDQVKEGAKGAEWDGIRNHQANNNMKEMKVGDLGFFYHSVDEKRVVGIVKVVKEHYPDPTDASGKFGMVDVSAVGNVSLSPKLIKTWSLMSFTAVMLVASITKYKNCVIVVLSVSLFTIIPKTRQLN